MIDVDRATENYVINLKVAQLEIKCQQVRWMQSGSFFTAYYTMNENSIEMSVIG